MHAANFDNDTCLLAPYLFDDGVGIGLRPAQPLIDVGGGLSGLRSRG
ncbi:MAG: hypothetical protein ACM3JG_06710 [Thiohalocapsa sp.]